MDWLAVRYWRRPTQLRHTDNDAGLFGQRRYEKNAIFKLRHINGSEDRRLLCRAHELVADVTF